METAAFGFRADDFTPVGVRSALDRELGNGDHAMTYQAVLEQAVVGRIAPRTCYRFVIETNRAPAFYDIH